MKTLIVAEPGGTHEGKLSTMLELIDVAAACGADCYKSQWVSNAQTMCDRRHAPEYLGSYLKLQYPIEYHAELREHAAARGLEYGCSCYIPGDFARVAPFVDYKKVSSFEASDIALIREALSASHEPVIISTGMGPQLILNPWDNALILACTSAYPAPISQLNLALIREHDLDGFSDHSHDVRIGAWAVAVGAQILETHFRLDDCDPANKDYAVAFTPAEFKAYIQNVRDCEAAMGDGIKRLQECEHEMERFRVSA
jgi:sialic acid synthase SpsE